MFRLDGKVALVTGAAHGIGAATARLFAEAGAAVALADIDGDGAEETAAEIGGIALTCDVADEGALAAAVAATEDRLGALHILVNNAAIQNTKGLMETSTAEWDAVIATNLSSVFHAMKAAVPAIERAGGGAIVNTSSTFAFVGSPGYAAYHAAKGGVSALTRAAALGLVDRGIRVNAVCPGTTDTPGLRAGVLAGGEVPDEAYAGYRAKQPMARFATAAEIAAGILYLASDAASFVTGTELVIDGGYTIQ